MLQAGGGGRYRLNCGMLTKAELNRLRSLRDKSTRETLGLFVVEGGKVVDELIAGGVPLLEIYATSRWAEPPRRPGSDSAALPVVRISEAEMARATHLPTPSPVLAVGRIPSVPFEAASLTRGLTLMLDGVQDPGNVGTLLRIADWFALDRVVLSPDTADLFHQKVINASMGSFARVTAHRVDLPPVLAEVRASSPGTPILGCDVSGDDVHGLPSLPDAIIVIGSEGRGLSPVIAAQVTRRITIPRYGRAESLNAAIAAGIICDQLRAKAGV